MNRSHGLRADIGRRIGKQDLDRGVPLFSTQPGYHPTDRLSRFRHGIVQQTNEVLRMFLRPEGGESLDRCAANPVVGVAQARKEIRDRLPAADLSQRLRDP